MIELATIERAETSVASILFDSGAMQALVNFGQMMSESVVTIPKHLQGKPSDCTAIALQAMQWRMNPYAVAQKTYITPGGALGYEAQLVNAVIVGSGAMEGRPEYRFIGDWDRILGKVKEERGQGGGKYYVAVWDKAEEQGLGIEVSATLTGEREPRTIRVMLTQAYPRFSTQWATDPQQQISYLALRKFARRYVPDAILGVYTVDEMQEVEAIDNETGEVTRVSRVARKPRAETAQTPPAEAARQPEPTTDIEVKETSAREPAHEPAHEPKQSALYEDEQQKTKPADKLPAKPKAEAKQSQEPEKKQAPAEEKQARPNGALASVGEIAFLRNKAHALGVDMGKLLQEAGGLAIDQLTKDEFDDLRAFLRSVEERSA